MTDPLRILMLGETLASVRPGGLNRYFGHLYAALRAEGANTVVALLGPADHSGLAPPVVGDVHGSLPHRLLTYSGRARRLADDVDVVDCHFALYAVLPLMTGALRRLPLVVHFHGPWADESLASRGNSAAAEAKGLIERLVYRRADLVVVLSQVFGRLVVERYRVNPARVVVVPPGVDLDRFRPGGRMAARRRFAIDESIFVAAAVRRLETRMGLDTLIRAWEQVQAARPDAVLLIAGDGPARTTLEMLRSRLSRPGNVRLLGPLHDSDVVELYRAADCSIVPSRSLEGFGLVVLESTACGTPAIVTDIGGLPETVDALDRSLVVPAEDVRALVDRLLAAADGALPSPGACRQHAEGFTWSDVAQRHLHLYRQVVTPAPRQLRVVFLDHCAQLSGGELALFRLLTALDVDAHVILAEKGPLVDRLRSAGVAVDVVPMAAAGRRLPRGKVRAWPAPGAGAVAAVAHSVRLARRLRRLRPDLVHTNSLKAALYGGAAGRMAGVPVVWHVRDRIAADYLPPLAVRLVRVAARILPSAVIANSGATLASLGRPGAVVPSPVDGVSVSQPARATRRPGDPLRVGMVGRLAPWKGQHVFIDAFARAFPDRSARGFLFGSPLFGAEDEAYAGEIRRLIGRLGLTDRVELRGQVEDTTETYRDLDMLVHASIVPEPFGLVVAEGMAAGVAVVAADAGGPAELITDGVDGCLYPPGDVAALAACLRVLGADEEMRSRLGRAGRRRAAALSPDRVAPSVADVYRDVLAGSGCTGPGGSVSAARVARRDTRSDAWTDGAMFGSAGSLRSVARVISRAATSGGAVFVERGWRFAADVGYRAITLRRPRRIRGLSASWPSHARSGLPPSSAAGRSGRLTSGWTCS